MKIVINQLNGSYLETIYSENFEKILREVKSPYGEPGAPDKILDIIKTTDLNNIIKKNFYDLQ